MDIDYIRLEEAFQLFKTYVENKQKKPFTAFNDGYVDQRESYKKTVQSDAYEKLGFSSWKVSEIGTGEIKKRVDDAIIDKVIHDNKSIPNNLIYWIQKDTFSKSKNNRELEQNLFDLFKNKKKDEVVFERLTDNKLSYQFIAYLFFIKDAKLGKKYLPISQEKFDSIFEYLGVSNFKTSHNLSWENYSIYCNLIKQVQEFLNSKSLEVTLLDAHSFLWMYKEAVEKNIKMEEKNKVETQKSNSNKELERRVRKVGEISVDEWKEILSNDVVTTPYILDIFIAFYYSPNYQNNASSIAVILASKSINKSIVDFSKRIDKHIFSIEFTKREGTHVDQFWDVPFDGWKEKSSGYFIWKLWPELVTALEQRGDVIKDHIYPNEINDKGLTEGVVKTITVNAYERNPLSRKLCLEHHGVSCKVCSMNFYSVYGEVGKDFIHVHHLKPIALRGGEYQVDPINDLVPVCPNCHAMLHKRSPEPYSIEELQKMILKVE